MSDPGRLPGGGRESAVLVFIDGTICDLRHRLPLQGTPAFHAREALQRDVPVKGSVESLHDLAEHYTIIYLGARPVATIPATEEWLRRCGYPPGMVRAAPTQQERLDIVHHLGRRFDVVGGIGDQWDDNELHLALGCVSIILKEYEGDWETVRRYIPAPAEAGVAAPPAGGAPTYRATSEIPPLVLEAKALTRQMRFELSCADEVGRLLHVLTGSVKEGTIGEIGTGCGVGSAWMISALAAGVRLITVDADAERAAACRAMFSPFPNVRVLRADWHELLHYGPFDMLFPDGGGAKQNEPEVVLNAVRPGGVVLLDDLTPVPMRTASGEGPDPVRDFFLNDRRLTATEVLVTPAHGVIIARRLE